MAGDYDLGSVLDFDQLPMVGNRTAIRIEPQKEFIDWLSYVIEGPIREKPLTNRAITFLIKEIENPFDFNKWLELNYGLLFNVMLNYYTIDKDDWPQKRDMIVFKSWFSVGVSEMILDLELEPIILI
jgi:hypothetical protein